MDVVIFMSPDVLLPAVFFDHDCAMAGQPGKFGTAMVLRNYNNDRRSGDLG